jgi:hypothetical protein
MLMNDNYQIMDSLKDLCETYVPMILCGKNLYV